jgi:flagella basal body P-ring formation protein FlgA
MLLAALFLDGLTISLRPMAEVEGNTIELGEIAVVAGVEPGLAASLEAVDFGYTPSPSYTRTILATKVAEKLRNDFPGLEFVVDGAIACTVTPRTQMVTNEEIEAAARAVLESAVTGERITLLLRSAVDDAIVPYTPVPPEVRATLNTPDVRSGIQSVSVRVEIDGRTHAVRQVHFDVQRWQTVAVLRRPVPSGTIITPDNVEEREVLVPPSQREPALTADMLIGSVTARYLDAGRAVQRIDVHRPKVVEARAPLILEVRHGQITARAAAIALEDGSAGDRIRVRIVDSGREMHVTVVSRELVVIELGAPTPVR